MTDYKLDSGRGDIQDLADLILENELYIDINSLNYIIASKGNLPKAEYRRYLHYVTLSLGEKIVALCMLVEQCSEEVIVGDYHYFSDAFYSVYVKPDYRGQGYAHVTTRALAEYLRDYFSVHKALFNRYSVMADVEGASLARKYFDVPVVCGGFPVHRGIRRVVARIHNQPFDEDCQLSDDKLYVVEPQAILSAQYTKYD